MALRRRRLKPTYPLVVKEGPHAEKLAGQTSCEGCSAFNEHGPKDKLWCGRYMAQPNQVVRPGGKCGPERGGYRKLVDYMAAFKPRPNTGY